MQYDPTIKLSPPLLQEIEQALHMIKGYGSIEIYVQDSIVTQITVRNIMKTKVDIDTEKSHQNGKNHKFISR